ncbi:2-aminoadipate aminotransferase [Thermus scotoductus]|uniref:2-aminoadipate aminotransferase n=1 Tax=Thermus scotoductus TaxID=37636 RepID=A0A430QWA9_THESC|nr:2-aminoadipate transaminase [Thermus scotoductus]RTG99351.1 2-aminoadipate aminotransferase [Thermus scotoductus]
MKTLDWSTLFGERASRIQASTIRELLKLTQRPGVLSFAGGLPAPELFPKEEAAAKAAEILREKGEVALQYGPTEGYLPLRTWVADWLKVSPEEVLITTGSQQALDLLGKVFLDEGSPVLLEAPSYMGAIQAFRAYGPRFLTVPAGEEGPDLSALEEALDQERPRFLYLIPSFQNPSGGLMPLEARRRLLEMAMERGLVVVEDDAYRELYFGESRLPSLFELAREAGYPGVIYLSSFSKVLAPGLRVAFVVARPEAILKLTQAKQGVDLHTPVLNQILVHELVKEGFPERLERIRTTYKAKAQAMLEALDREMPKEVAYTRPKGGMFVWMELPKGLSAEALFQRAIAENVAFVPGGPFFANGGGENTLRLSYATMDRERIQEGVRRLGQALKGLLAVV